MKVRKSKKAVGPSKFSPPVGFQIAPAAPAGGGTNVPAMRPTFAFLPYNQDAFNKFVSDEQLKVRAENPTLAAEDFPGVQNPYGTGIIPETVGTRTNLNQLCSNKGGRVWVQKSKQCECPDGYFAKTKDSPCQPYSF